VVVTHPRPIIDVDVMHATAIGSNAAGMVALKPVDDGTVLAAWRMEIDGPAGRMMAAPSSSGNPCTASEG